MRSPFVRPLRIIAAVESMLRTSFVAVPALRRLEPARISGPTSTTIGTATASASAEPGTHVTHDVNTPRARAAFIAAELKVSVESVQAFEKAHPEVEVHMYAADHGFNCDQRGSYDADSAKLARERSLEFLRKHVG